jgi:hypothetical protein
MACWSTPQVLRRERGLSGAQAAYVVFLTTMCVATAGDRSPACRPCPDTNRRMSAFGLGLWFPTLPAKCAGRMGHGACVRS